MLENDFKKTFFYAVKRKTITFAERLIVHFASILVALGSSKTLYDQTLESGFFSSLGISFMIYMGLISLFPAGNPRRTDWFVPFLGACVLGVVCYFKLMPWQFIVFWMGVQSWLLRLVCKKTRRQEWLAAPWLALALVCYATRYGALSATPALFIAIPVITAGGFLLSGMLNRFVFVPLRRRQLGNLATHLESFLFHKRLPLPFEEPVQLLVTNSRIVAKAIPNLDDSMVTPIMAMGIVANKLSILVAGDSSRWTTEGERVLQAIGMLNEDFDRRLVGFDAVAVDMEEEPAEIDPKTTRCNEFLEMTTQLALKKGQLPQHLHQPLDSVRLSTRGIVDSMLSDPFDYEPGEKFLNRYLPALQKVVDEYIRLYHTVDPGHSEVDRVITRSEELIMRLEKAFKRERAHLLRNDTMELNAELATLDTLLKIDGR